MLRRGDRHPPTTWSTHAQNRVELANDLANALMNKGVALHSLGRLSEAVACYDEAIAIRRDLVHAQNRVELANDLAKALMDKGVAARGRLGRLSEAVACYDEAIAILDDLVHAKNRVELANVLASQPS